METYLQKLLHALTDYVGGDIQNESDYLQCNVEDGRFCYFVQLINLDNPQAFFVDVLKFHHSKNVSMDISVKENRDLHIKVCYYAQEQHQEAYELMQNILKLKRREAK